MKFCTSFAPPPIARPASKTRVLCTLRQCSPVWRYACARICERVTGAFLICNAGKFQCAAHSVWGARNFFIGYSTIIINAARTLLTKACKSGFYLIVAFWLRFLFVTELIWAVAAIFHSEANTAGSEWDRLPGFSAYQVFASWAHTSECGGC